jgi:hypothetical protein
MCSVVKSAKKSGGKLNREFGFRDAEFYGIAQRAKVKGKKVDWLIELIG